MAKRDVQMELPVTPGWGGRRRGAGRPPGLNAGTPHVERPELKARHPVHVTLRVAQGLPNLRAKAQFRIVKDALRGIRRRFAFRVVHYSVQSNHLHLVCEAHDKASLGRGLKGLQVRIAKALNKLLGRRGAVFPTRYHARILKTPREVRNALRYRAAVRAQQRATPHEAHALAELDGPMLLGAVLQRLERRRIKPTPRRRARRPAHVASEEGLAKTPPASPKRSPRSRTASSLGAVLSTLGGDPGRT